MPKSETAATGTPSESLTPQAATAKFAGLLTEVEPEEPPAATPEAAVASASDEAKTPETPPPPEPSDQDPSPEDKHLVTVDGEESEVTLDELKSGYSYKAHNTREAQRIAEERRAFESEQQTVRQKAHEYEQGLAQVAQALEALTGEPNWEQLRKELPPDKFLERKADWELAKANTERLKAKQQQLAAEREAQLERAQDAYYRAESDKLKAAVPEFGDPDKGKELNAKLKRHLKGYGFTDEQIGQVTDHRLVLLALDAMKYKDLHREPSPEAKKKTPIRTAPPGKPVVPKPNERQTKLIEQAARSRRQGDAAKAIESLLGDD